MTIYITSAEEFVGHLPHPEVDFVIDDYQYVTPTYSFNFYIFCSFRSFATIHRRNGAPTFLLLCRVWYHGHHSSIAEFSQVIDHHLILSEAQARNLQQAFDFVVQNLCDTYLHIDTPVTTPTTSSDSE